MANWQEHLKPSPSMMLVPDWYVAARRENLSEEDLTARVREFCAEALEARDTTVDEQKLDQFTRHMTMLYAMAYRTERFGDA